MATLTPEIIRAEFIGKSGTFQAVAKKLSVNADELEAYCLSLCKQNPDEFSYKTFLTNPGLKKSLPNTVHLSMSQTIPGYTTARFVISRTRFCRTNAVTYPVRSRRTI